jgi:hypothetical protein
MKDNESIEQLLNLHNQLDAVQKEEVKGHLIFYINHLLLYDFDKLVQILYRVDVSENKLKDVLKKNSGTDAAIIIADLLMERQEEKLKTKEAFKKSNGNIPGEDKW